LQHKNQLHFSATWHLDHHHFLLLTELMIIEWSAITTNILPIPPVNIQKFLKNAPCVSHIFAFSP
jgi:hypothetical protein